MKNKNLLIGLVTLALIITLAACGQQSSQTSETPAQTTVASVADEDKPSIVSNVQSVAGVPLLTLNNGTEVPQLGLGTQIQSLEQDSSATGRKLLNDTTRESVVAALQSGYRHLDTAHGYYNEEGVGQAIKESGVPREEIWLTSKLWPSEYENASQAIDEMLDRLQVDYIDMVYLHHPTGDYLSAYRALENAVREGKVRAIGISNFDNEPEIFEDIMENAEIQPQALQIEMHPFAQRLETRTLAEENDIQVEAWYPLGHADPELLENEVLVEIAENHNKTVPQTILRWFMQEGIATVPGSTNPEHIAENIDIFDFELSDDEIEQIRDLDKGEAGRYFNLDYDIMGIFFGNLDE
ncbi:TPA: aldo/keto reductase [Streptococcus suis]|nr:aldo/keto reductase [Streptococcus suis]